MNYKLFTATSSGTTSIYTPPTADDYISIYDGTNAQLGVSARLIDQIKKELGINRVLEKCNHCGQWGAVMCACPHCGAPIDPK